jgi:hypothetical protein
MEKEDYKTALSHLKSNSDMLPWTTMQLFKHWIDAIETNILLGSDLGSTADFKRLMRDGTLYASPISPVYKTCYRTIKRLSDDGLFYEELQVPYQEVRWNMKLQNQKGKISKDLTFVCMDVDGNIYDFQMFSITLCARSITLHAAAALSSSGIKFIDVRDNLRLLTMPTKELSSIRTLEGIDCSGCPHLCIPLEVVEQGGSETLLFLRDCVKNGAINDTLSIFFIVYFLHRGWGGW